MGFIVTGSGGQLGRSLVRSLSLRAPEIPFRAFDFRELDITDVPGVIRALEAVPGVPPHILVNAAAFTQVDRCEDERELAFRINAEAPEGLAQACLDSGVKLVHLSTDYVFDGEGSQPYREEDSTRPLSVYGQSKLEGEARVRETSGSFLVVRTSWLFGPGRNFVRTMLELAAGSRRQPLRGVDDQRGSPTYSGDLADGILRLVEAGASGLYHLASQGEASWWDLAREALDGGGYPEVSIERVPTSEFPRPAKRPAYSVLACDRAAQMGVRLRNWREAVGGYLSGPDAPNLTLESST